MGREQPISGSVELGAHGIVPNYFEQNQVRYPVDAAQTCTQQHNALSAWNSYGIVLNCFEQNQVRQPGDFAAGAAAQQSGRAFLRMAEGRLHMAECVGTCANLCTRCQQIFADV